MDAWDAYVATEDCEQSIADAATQAHRESALFYAFLAGYVASERKVQHDTH